MVVVAYLELLCPLHADYSRTNDYPSSAKPV